MFCPLIDWEIKSINDFRRQQELSGEIEDLSMTQSFAMTAKKQIYEQRTCYGCGKTDHFIQLCKDAEKFTFLRISILIVTSLANGTPAKIFAF